MKNNKNYLRLFVYGTLKRGFWNHDRFCSQAVNIEPATTWGRLYHLPAGFPALEVPDTCILAHGTVDPIADARTQNSAELSGNAMTQPDGDWDLVHGEIITFDDPALGLLPIDRLEGFNPNGQSMYQRVLVAVSSENQIRSVWLYHYEFGHNGQRVASGQWNQA